MKLKTRIIIVVLFIFTALFSVTAYEIFISYHNLEIEEITIKSDKINQPVDMVLISDLHDHEFGQNNSKLITKLQEINPDAILMAGDMMNSTSDRPDVAVDLIQRLVKDYPVYYSLGNQEIEYMELHHSTQLIKQLESAGVIVLEEEYEDVEVNGNLFSIGGIYDYAFEVDGAGHMSKKDMDPDLLNYLEEFQSKDNFKLMMSHRPDSFIFGEAGKTWNIDLVVSGHVHGGQVVLPFLGGLWAPDQGWFPDYVAGYYKFDTLDMVITSGLGSHKEILPRFNNPPEIMVLHMVQKASVKSE